MAQKPVDQHADDLDGEGHATSQRPSLDALTTQNEALDSSLSPSEDKSLDELRQDFKTVLTGSFGGNLDSDTSSLAQRLYAIAHDKALAVCLHTIAGYDSSQKQRISKEAWQSGLEGIAIESLLIIQKSTEQQACVLDADDLYISKLSDCPGYFDQQFGHTPPDAFQDLTRRWPVTSPVNNSAVTKKCALELAIELQCTTFLANSTVKNVVDLLYSGKLSLALTVVPWYHRHTDNGRLGPIHLPNDEPVSQSRPIANISPTFLQIILNSTSIRYRNLIYQVHSVVFLYLYLHVLLDSDYKNSWPDGQTRIFYIFILGELADSIFLHISKVSTQAWRIWLQLPSLVVLVASMLLRYRGLASQNNPEEMISSIQESYTCLCVVCPAIFSLVVFQFEHYEPIGKATTLISRCLRSGLPVVAAAAVLISGFWLAIWRIEEDEESMYVLRWLVLGAFGAPDLEKTIRYNPLPNALLFFSFLFLVTFLLGSLMIAIFIATYQQIITQIDDIWQLQRATEVVHYVYQPLFLYFPPPWNLLSYCVSLLSFICGLALGFCTSCDSELSMSTRRDQRSGIGSACYRAAVSSSTAPIPTPSTHETVYHKKRKTSATSHPIVAAPQYPQSQIQQMENADLAELRQQGGIKSGNTTPVLTNSLRKQLHVQTPDADTRSPPSSQVTSHTNLLSASHPGVNGEASLTSSGDSVHPHPVAENAIAPTIYLQVPEYFYSIDIFHLINLLGENHILTACKVLVLTHSSADMLNRLVSHNDLIPLTPSNLTRFHSRAPPSISVHEYLKRIVKYTSVEKAPLVCLLVYIDRVCDKHPTFTINSLTVHRFIITGITVAAKALCDSYCTNSHYAKVGGISTQELNTLELEFLSLLSWQLACTGVTLQQYYVNLVRQHPAYVRRRDRHPDEFSGHKEELTKGSPAGSEASLLISLDEETNERVDQAALADFSSLLSREGVDYIA
ncbi:hypothetical protein BZG36_01490 [Bifiguratus adelaidae]|uniref:Cyclin N-terminal domain-containing protein n=1 Tax=Bifiguratus adelaidae TaxID=1938954 RepID=A0A261Y4T4_9FUNG|nr:hypothetical protein BZG36_01490 [Bifiguratus adelaidae]